LTLRRYTGACFRSRIVARTFTRWTFTCRALSRRTLGTWTLGTWALRRFSRWCRALRWLGRRRGTFGRCRLCSFRLPTWRIIALRLRLSLGLWLGFRFGLFGSWLLCVGLFCLGFGRCTGRCFRWRLGSLGSRLLALRFSTLRFTTRATLRLGLRFSGGTLRAGATLRAARLLGLSTRASALRLWRRATLLLLFLACCTFRTRRRSLNVNDVGLDALCRHLNARHRGMHAGCQKADGNQWHRHTGEESCTLGHDCSLTALSVGRPEASARKSAIFGKNDA
jgi:hypothetical protein